ncbi:CD209 antigen-like protein A [Pholidichthys leucotaenia]
MLASITVLLIWVAMKDGHHDLKYNQLNQNSSRLQTNNSGKCCPDRWMRWRGSCYFKSTKKESWADSRTKCKRRGADLVIIDSREEQEFVSELTINEESWIGLMTTGYEWKWVDGSNLTTMFWEEGAGNYSDHDNVAVCCNKDGQWTQSELNEKKGWICEKHP